MLSRDTGVPPVIAMKVVKGALTAENNLFAHIARTGGTPVSRLSPCT